MIDTTRLEVLIVAYGRRGIESVAALEHPHVENVRYIVGWQTDGENPDAIPASLRERRDFRIIPSDSRGVARNRNLTLDAASAPIVLESDDDVSYTAEQLQSVIQAFEANPDYDFISFKYHSQKHPRPYPKHEADLAKPPKGYFIGGIEMAFRLDAIRRTGIRFNERFGIGAEFPSGEEDLFLHDVVKAGLKAKFIPMEIVTHESDSTCMREMTNPDFIRTKGAIHRIIHPYSWPMRMLSHALRETHGRHSRTGAILSYCRHWIRGARSL